jgi:hypothetical protein
MGPIYCPETSVKDCHSMLRNTPEEHRSQATCSSKKKNKITSIWRSGSIVMQTDLLGKLSPCVLLWTHIYVFTMKSRSLRGMYKVPARSRIYTETCSHLSIGRSPEWGTDFHSIPQQHMHSFQSRSERLQSSCIPLKRLFSQKLRRQLKDRLQSGEALRKTISAIFNLSFFESFYFLFHEQHLQFQSL